MTVLAIDVTGPGGGAALVRDGKIDVGLLPEGSARGRDLVPQIERLLARAGLAPGGLAAVACAVGPGSFTGIRIGIATAATLAYAANAPVIPVGSLHGIAANAPADALRVAVAIDARREHVYAATFRRSDGEMEPEGDYRHLPAAEFANALEEDAWLLGDARARYEGLLGRFSGADDATVRPDVVARLGARAFADGRTIPPAELRPLYLRLSDPEIRRMEG